MIDGHALKFHQSSTIENLSQSRENNENPIVVTAEEFLSLCYTTLSNPFQARKFRTTL